MLVARWSLQSTCDPLKTNLCLVLTIPTPRLSSSYTHFRTYKPPLPIRPFSFLTALLLVVVLFYSFADTPPRLTLLDTAFKQQRLKAWQPILTPKSVLPTLFLIGLLFAPIGAVLVWGSGTVTSFKIDYTDCDLEAPGDGSAAGIPGGKFDCECCYVSFGRHFGTGQAEPTSPSSSTSRSARRQTLNLSLRDKVQRPHLVIHQRHVPTFRATSSMCR